MRKLILKGRLSPGDETMRTAAVRDLHITYPYQFKTDVDTSCPELWENNPYLTPLDVSDPDVEVIEMHYPLINESNQKPYHFIHGYIHFLNDYLDLNIKPTAFKGDIHISDKEKSWIGQVQEIVGSDLPFWIIDAGGKTDYTIKWWDVDRYQAVVDHFRDRILFVQVGAIAPGHYHPKLNGVIDLRGKTDLRQLVRLVYHSQGVLCPVTSLMHLAAAVESGVPRPCVVIAGGREAPQWEAYPSHQFIHNVGALECCRVGGCWRSRTTPQGDGDEKDSPDKVCLDVVDDLPRCMSMITPEMVIERIETYFTGDSVSYLDKAIPYECLTAPEIALKIPENIPGGICGIHTIEMHTDDGIIKYYPNKSADPDSFSYHDLFRPRTLKEAMESVVGECNGFTAQERWEKETPLFAQHILDNLEPGEKVLLDYGCGVGRVAKEILRWNKDVVIIGVDSSVDELRLAKEYVDDDRFITRLPHQLDRSVDLAYSIYVFQHIPAIEIREALQHIHRSLKDDGKFIQCCSEYRMAIRYDQKAFADDKHLGVDIDREIGRYFNPIDDLFSEETLEANSLVKKMVTGGRDGIAHPATLYQKRPLGFNDGGVQ